MALEKEVVTPSGVVGNYHRIVKVEVSASDECATVVVAIYPTAETRATFDTPIWHEYVRIPINSLAEDPFTLFYEALKTSGASYLNGATDSDT